MRTKLLFVFSIFACVIAFGQETKVMEDLKLWTGAKYSKSLFHKKIDLSFESEMRFKNDMSNLNVFFVEPALQYSFSKFIETGIQLRVSNKNIGTEKKETLYRYGANLKLKHKAKRLTASYRFKYENTENNFQKNDTLSNNNSIIRNKLQFKYNIKNSSLTPFASSELFYMLKGEETDFYKLRFTLGTMYSLKKAGKIKLFYRIDREINTPHPFNYYIVGTAYVFKS